DRFGEAGDLLKRETGPRAMARDGRVRCERLSVSVDRLIVTARVVQEPRLQAARARADGIELEGAGALGQGFFRPALGAEEEGVHLVNQRGPRIELRGAAELGARALPVELVEELDLRERGVALAQTPIELQRPLDRRSGL